MSNKVIIKKKITKFKKVIKVSGDKSLSIRWVLFSSLGSGISKAKNLLISEDVLAAIEIIKKLGIKVSINNNFCDIYGKGIESKLPVLEKIYRKDRMLIIWQGIYLIHNKSFSVAGKFAF